jgi:hypothetical protein
MPATIEREPVYVLRLSGTVGKNEFNDVQSTLAKDIDAGVKPRILASLDGFAGWERGADWGDLEFLFSHSNEIEKIAIVGESRWETNAMAFAGAGHRRAPVKFFHTQQIKEARHWLAE